DARRSVLPAGAGFRATFALTIPDLAHDGDGSAAGVAAGRFIARVAHAPLPATSTDRNDAESQARLPDAVQDTVRHHRRDSVAGAGHRRERRDLLPLRPVPAPAAAGHGTGAAG